MTQNTYLDSFRKTFEISTEKMLEIAYGFRQAMEAGLQGQESPLKMLPSFIERPSGNEEGVFYTVDMGGTNVRSTKFKLSNRGFERLGEVKSRLKDPDGNYDYTNENTSAEMLFDFFAKNTEKLIQQGEQQASLGEGPKLGHTFSFPSRQVGINEAYLIEWTKEIKVAGVVGNNPNKLLKEALQRHNIDIEPVAILNDTVGTLLVAQYTHENADIGVIMGTGYNSCYLEGKHPLTGKEMIVNMEAGNFNIKLPLTKYDIEIDKRSVIPGAQLLEKMVSGYYIGEIATLIIEDFYANKAIFDDTDSMNKFRSKKIDSLDVENYILYPERTTHVLGCSLDDAMKLKDISKSIVLRTARLVVATLFGTLLHIEDNEIKNEHVIAVDGTIFEKMPNVPELMQQAMDELTRSPNKIVFKLVKDGSGLGAAIAAAVAEAKSY